MRQTDHLQAMVDQGSGGAFEISQRMTAMLGWGATASFKEDWTWNQAAETYALDPEMAAKLRKSNPQVPQLLSWWISRSLSMPHRTLQQKAWALQAFGNLLRRMLEASGRGIWDADPEMLSKLKAMYGELDDELEGV